MEGGLVCIALTRSFFLLVRVRWVSLILSEYFRIILIGRLPNFAIHLFIESGLQLDHHCLRDELCFLDPGQNVGRGISAEVFKALHIHTLKLVRGWLPSLPLSSLSLSLSVCVLFGIQHRHQPPNNATNTTNNNNNTNNTNTNTNNAKTSTSTRDAPLGEGGGGGGDF
jgi:hypothetical protein